MKSLEAIIFAPYHAVHWCYRILKKEGDAIGKWGGDLAETHTAHTRDGIPARSSRHTEQTNEPHRTPKRRCWRSCDFSSSALEVLQMSTPLKMLTTEHSSVIFLERAEIVPLAHCWFQTKQQMEVIHVSQLCHVFQDPNIFAQLGVFVAYGLLHQIHSTEF